MRDGRCMDNLVSIGVGDGGKEGGGQKIGKIFFPVIIM